MQFNCEPEESVLAGRGPTDASIISIFYYNVIL